MLQNKEFNPENFNTSAINHKRHASEKKHGGNHGEISASKSTGKHAETL